MYPCGLFPGMQNRIGLDVMRSIAIFLVLYLHSLYLLPGGMGKYLQPIDFLLRLDGVGIFFVLSGFLIGHFLLELEKSQSLNLKEIFRFLLRRWFRTLPNYYLIYTFILLAGGQALNPKMLLFVHNFSVPYMGYFQEYWSLAVEEFTYLAFPLSLWLFGRFHSKPYYLAGVFLILFGLWCQFLAPSQQYLYWERTVLGRFSSIVLGLVSCKLFFSHSHFFQTYRVHFFLLACLLLAAQHQFPELVFQTPLYYSLESVWYVMAIPFFFYLKIPEGLLHNFFYRASKYSYSLYLLNLFPFQYIILPWIKQTFFGGQFPGPYPFVFDYLLYWTLIPLISHFLYNYWEKPFMLLRKHL